LGKVSNAKQGEWLTIKGRASGTFLKIVNPPNQYLHFCGLKAWAYYGSYSEESSSSSSSSSGSSSS